jgi:hypothetical protein
MIQQGDENRIRFGPKPYDALSSQAVGGSQQAIGASQCKKRGV